MKKRALQLNKYIETLKNREAGFTLIETMVAIFVLVLAMGALFSLAAGGIFSARYARNQIVATYLLQESVEAVRNARDSAAQSGTYDWNQWLAEFNVDQNGASQGVSPLSFGCFSSEGCTVDPYITDSKLTVQACGGACPELIFYPDDGFYGYTATYPGIDPSQASYTTSYVRKITLAPVSGNPNQYTVTGEIRWANGSSTKKLEQSVLLTNWKP